MSEMINTIQIYKICDMAIENAKSFGKNLDFSEKSIIDVEEILDYYSKDLNKGFVKSIFQKIKGEKPTESQIYSMAMIWGVYVGEVIRIKIGDRCMWVNENVSNYGEILHIKVGEGRAFPIEKVYKRLKNGTEDNVKLFYDVILIKLLEEI